MQSRASIRKPAFWKARGNSVFHDGSTGFVRGACYGFIQAGNWKSWFWCQKPVFGQQMLKHSAPAELPALGRFSKPQVTAGDTAGERNICRSALLLGARARQIITLPSLRAQVSAACCTMIGAASKHVKWEVMEHWTLSQLLGSETGTGIQDKG